MKIKEIKEQSKVKEIRHKKMKIIKQFRKKSGITLTTLVVTIIIILILAGISVASMLGEGGILAQTQNSKEVTEKDPTIESAKIDIYKEQSNNNGKITEEQFKKILEKYFIYNSESELPKDLSELILTTKDGKYNDIKASEIFDGKFSGNTDSEIEKISIGEAINAKYYGWKVENYTVEEAKVGCWRLFYQDKDYTYLLADNKFSLDNSVENIYTLAGFSEKTGVDVSTIGQGLNSMFEEIGGFSVSNTNKSIKAVAFLTDPEQWEQYKSDDAEFAIGGPTMELFVKSFNATGEVEQDGRKTLALAVDDGFGYHNAGSEQHSILTSYNNGIYNKDDNGWWWLGSPSSLYEERVRHITQEYGCISDGGVNMWCFVRPLVCIRTSVFKSKYEKSLVDE